MVVQTFNYTTGPSTLLDFGELSYNGCVFSPLFTTTVNGNVVKDNAGRTTKWVEYTIMVDGYVTLPAGAETIDGRTFQMRDLLTAQGGALTYSGRGFNLSVNTGPARNLDLAWGPIPRLLEFQPLGSGQSAKVKWQVEVRVSHETPVVFVISKSPDPTLRTKGVGGAARGGFVPVPLLQFNYETTVTYGEDYYSSLSIKGTLEIALTRTPNQQTRTMTLTADNMRSAIERVTVGGIDLSRFRITNRSFNVSRDKRVLEWSFAAEEKGYMDLPEDCTVARGSYSVRPLTKGKGLMNWVCTLQATYTVRKDRPRRTAWLAFLLLARERMSRARNDIPLLKDGPAAQNPPLQTVLRAGGVPAGGAVAAGAIGIDTMAKLLQSQDRAIKNTKVICLLDFQVDEGIYQDSKTTSFSMSWQLVAPFTTMLAASGVWKKVPEKNAAGKNLWAISMADISGAESWLPNKLDPAADVIVDFGSGH